MQIGCVDEYNDAKKKRLEQWMRANKIKDEKKVCVFLSVIGADAYRLLKNLVSPTVPSAMTYLVELVTIDYNRGTVSFQKA